MNNKKNEKNIEKKIIASFQNVKKDFSYLKKEIENLKNENKELKNEINDLKNSLYRHSVLIEKIIYEENAIADKLKRIFKKTIKKN